MPPALLNGSTEAERRRQGANSPTPGPRGDVGTETRAYDALRGPPKATPRRGPGTPGVRRVSGPTVVTGAGWGGLGTQPLYRRSWPEPKPAGAPYSPAPGSSELSNDAGTSGGSSSRFCSCIQAPKASHSRGSCQANGLPSGGAISGSVTSTAARCSRGS